MKTLRTFMIVCSTIFFVLSVCGMAAAEETGKININTATLDELTQLDNIGAQKAEKIIEHREKTPFEKIEDITLVSGIGEKTFEKIKDRITVGEEPVDAQPAETEDVQAAEPEKPKAE